jgi:lipid-A-disaccharide synthase
VKQKKTVFVSAGEPSGDAHAAALVSALKQQVADLEIEGVGGPSMERAGVKLMARIEDLTVIGLVEVARKVPAHLRLLREIKRRLALGDVALVVLVDYPGFHLRVAEAARKAGVPVLYYIAPQLWAWGAGRVRRMARDVSHLAVILPFEERFFRSHGLEVTFVGHPLLDREGPPADRSGLKQSLGLDATRPVLGLFPGSRPQEARRLWPVFRDAARLVQADRPQTQVLVAAVPGCDYPDGGSARIVGGRPADCFAAADAALCKSGTSTLEAALAGTPLVVAYRMAGLSFLMARRLVKVPWIGLVNLVAERQVAPEFVQQAARPDRLAAAALPLLDAESPERQAQLKALAEVRLRLGEPGASRRAAAIAARFLAA